MKPTTIASLDRAISLTPDEPTYIYYCGEQVSPPTGTPISDGAKQFIDRLKKLSEK